MMTLSPSRRAAMAPALHTPRLRLDAFTSGDAGELHQLFADPATHTVGSGPFTAFEQTARWIADREATQRDHGLCWYAVRCAATGRLLGNCGMLRGRTGFVEPEIGYEISASHRGRGYATEAALAVLQECRTAGLGRVWATIRPYNTASRRIVARLGMRLDRAAADERGDLLFYVIDRLSGRPAASVGPDPDGSRDPVRDRPPC